MKVEGQLIRRGRWAGGFSLIATVTILVLLSLVAVGMLTLSTVTIRSANTDAARATARANARLALTIALGELQKHAGPDRRVTGHAAILKDGVNHPHWLGVWDTENDDTEAAWLVSGNDTLALDDLNELKSYPGDYTGPDDALPGNESTLLFDGLQDTPEREKVRVPHVDVEVRQQTGRYAWWIADEGTKARVDVAAPNGDPKNEYDRMARARSAQEPALAMVDGMMKPLERGEEFDRRRLITVPSLELAVDDAEAATSFFHHLTTGGAGLPVNVVAGGMKNDLSIVFDSSQRRQGFVDEFLGANPGETEHNGSTVYEFQVRDPERFYLSKELTRDGRLPVGPNWGILYNYARMWENGRNHRMGVVRLTPNLRTDLRRNDWAPYSNIDRGPWQNDKQHTNSGVYPVVGMLQMGFRLSAKEVPGGRGRPADYQMQLQMKPLVGLWNPYNVRLEASSYAFDWALYPYLRIGIIPPSGGQITPRVWMRESWISGSNSSSTSAVDRGLDKWFRLVTESTDFEPGEFRIFSVDSRTNISGENRLVSTWNEEGAFTFDLAHSRFNGGANAGQLIKVPAGSVTWYGDLFLEDYQHAETTTHFGEAYGRDGASASWITMKGAGGTLHRVSDIWQTPAPDERTRVPYAIPEQVISHWRRTGGITSPKLPVEQIARTPYHIGTWRWFSRTATGAQDDNQDARGWIDCNPRFASTNPAWDGSKTGKSRRGSISYEGWNFISPLLGASYDESYDNGPPGRGKVAEGQNEVPTFPEATKSGGRYRAFTGYSNSSAGQTHVAIYDIPRSPLVSIGQFQHAQLARYGYEPGFVVGNSYANPRIPLEEVLVEDFGGVPNFTMLDLSYRMNESLWDDYFFSTIGRDYYGPAGGRGNSLDRKMPIKNLVDGSQSLPNPRHRFRARGDDSSFAKIISEAGEDAPRAIAARIMVEGAFNVNSTSKEAWKAVLSSMADFELPTISEDGRSPSWELPEGIRFPRFGHVIGSEAWGQGDDGRSSAFWRAYRSMDADELDDLAEEIVEEIRERGPFRSFADFVNRDPDADRELSQRMGALQAALDRALNDPIADGVGGRATNPRGKQFSAAINGESEAAGQAGYLLQGDVLQNLGPILQVRSDYFRIRAAGEALDSRGNVVAREVCEAFVQRVPEYLDGEDLPEVLHDELESKVNERFGRQFRVVSFRWLSQEEV